MAAVQNVVSSHYGAHSSTETWYMPKTTALFVLDTSAIVSVR